MQYKGYHRFRTLFLLLDVVAEALVELLVVVFGVGSSASSSFASSRPWSLFLGSCFDLPGRPLTITGIEASFNWDLLLANLPLVPRTEPCPGVDLREDFGSKAYT